MLGDDVENSWRTDDHGVGLVRPKERVSGRGANPTTVR